MPTSVIVDIVPKDKRYYLLFTDNEFSSIDQMWTKPDKLLDSLQKSKGFEGKTSWADLDPLHFRFLIMQALDSISLLPDNEQQDEENPFVRGLHFFIMGFIRCVELRSDIDIDLLKIKKYDDNTANFEYNSSITVSLNPVEEQTKLKVVVDNTKDDNT